MVTKMFRSVFLLSFMEANMSRLLSLIQLSLGLSLRHWEILQSLSIRDGIVISLLTPCLKSYRPSTTVVGGSGWLALATVAYSMQGRVCHRILKYPIKSEKQQDFFLKGMHKDFLYLQIIICMNRVKYINEPINCE